MRTTRREPRRRRSASTSERWNEDSPEIIRRRCFLQYGSTLRNLGRIDDSLRAFARARAEFPESVALGAFEALTFHADGRPNTALASLLVLLADHVDAPELDRYKPALRGNAHYLASLDAEDDDVRPEAR